MKKSSVANLLLVALCVIIYDVKSERSVRKVKPVEEISLGIVGGRNITIEEAPYQVCLNILKPYNTLLKCAGSIISEKFILTAAHCLIDAIQIDIIVGTAYIKNITAVYNSEKIYIHPLYDDWTADYDVGIIKIVKGISLNGITTKIIKLTDEDTDLETGSNIMVTGWGITSEKVSYDDYLLGVELPIVSQDECNKICGTLTPSQFCAGKLKGGKSVCQGDSGAPAVLVKSGTQVGIASKDFGCAVKGIPGVYINIANSRIRKFIKNITNV